MKGKPHVTQTSIKLTGFRIGHAHDASVKTGVTVILPDAPARCSVDVRGGGPGTRETAALQDGGLIDKVHAITLAGGSVYGLGAADSVTAWLGHKGIGYHAYDNVPVSPIVPSAILFDNANGGNKDWGTTPPFARLGLAACEAASSESFEGKFGAGYGATAGLYEGGMGLASETLGGITITAIIASNPIGSPYMPGTSCPWAWPYEVDSEFGGTRPSPDYKASPAKDTKLSRITAAGQATIIGAVMIDAGLSQPDLKRLAIMAQDGLPMAVQPAHTPLDGDTLFTVSIGDKPTPAPAGLAELGAAAARCTARAIMRGVYQAQKA